jgi:ABC-2 type transport system ATP-binding protein
MIDEFIDENINSLSGGQKQRVNLSLAMMVKPELMIFDEISSGLDILTKNIIIDQVKLIQKQNNATSIIISHNSDEISELADRILLLKNGEISIDITKDEILKKYKTIDSFLREVIK